MAKAKKKTTRRKKNEPSSEEVWSSLKEEVGMDTVVPYTMTGAFEVNMAIDHPKFGIGVVTASQSHKIEVAFEDGSRSLGHNRS